MLLSRPRRQPSFGVYSGLQIAVNGTIGRLVAPLGCPF